MTDPAPGKTLTRDQVRRAKDAGRAARVAGQPRTPPEDLDPDLQRWWLICWDRADEKRKARAEESKAGG